MFNDVIRLVGESKSVNEYGDVVVEKTERVVFAQMKSIGQSEFYQAQAIGLKPEIKFVIADYLDYRDEKKLVYERHGGEELEYNILRTFRSGNTLEIVCNREID